MIRVSVTYPSADGGRFDHDYYATTHVPLAVKAWGPDRAEIDRGLNGPAEAVAYFYFPTLEAFQAAMASPATGEVMADMANYTDLTPVLQVSEIVG